MIFRYNISTNTKVLFTTVSKATVKFYDVKIFGMALGQLETVEMETGNGKWKRKQSKLNARVKPLINDHLL